MASQQPPLSSLFGPERRRSIVDPLPSASSSRYTFREESSLSPVAKRFSGEHDFPVAGHEARRRCSDGSAAGKGPTIQDAIAHWPRSDQELFRRYSWTKNRERDAVQQELDELRAEHVKYAYHTARDRRRLKMYDRLQQAFAKSEERADRLGEELRQVRQDNACLNASISSLRAVMTPTAPSFGMSRRRVDVGVSTEGVQDVRMDIRTLRARLEEETQRRVIAEQEKDASIRAAASQQRVLPVLSKAYKQLVEMSQKAVRQGGL